MTTPRFLKVSPTRWPLLAAIVSAAMLATAHAFETFGHLAPCELCLKQREVYWVALAVGLVGFAAGRRLKTPLSISLPNLVLALVFLFGAGLAAYHAGVEWKWWPGPTSCTGSAAVSADAMAGLLSGAKVPLPACDQAAWRLLGVSMAGWNALVSLGLAAISFRALTGRRRGL
jgi:disulfide bond formation protein DsbB